MNSIRKIAIGLVVVLSLSFGFSNVALAANVLPNNDSVASERQAFVGKISNFKIASIATTSVKLTWKKASAATKYVLYRSNNKSTGYKSIKTLGKSSTSYIDTNLKPATTYYYKLVPYAGTTKGVSTSVLSAKTKSNPTPPTPVEKPNISIFMSSRTDENAIVVGMLVTNRGTNNLTIKTTNARLVDDDYASFNRDLGLLNSKGQFVDRQVIAPGQESYVGFGVVYPAYRTWYDRYSRLYFDFEYAGKQYQGIASSYYGSVYRAY